MPLAEEGNKLQHSSTPGHLEVLHLLSNFFLLLYFNLKTLDILTASLLIFALDLSFAPLGTIKYLLHWP